MNLWMTHRSIANIECCIKAIGACRTSKRKSSDRTAKCKKEIQWNLLESPIMSIIQRMSSQRFQMRIATFEVSFMRGCPFLVGSFIGGYKYINRHGGQRYRFAT